VTVPPLDEAAMDAAFERQQSLTKPAGALGKLEGLSIWLAGVQGECPPRPLARRRLVVFAGDHGVAQLGVSAYPAEVTAQMVANMRSGGAACCVLARQYGVGIRVEDVSVGRPS
jgi:nicotinate-nucleotide--dimethylbenzimidazole phosphoribosyltransferase